jgi:hypothetical protein
MKRRSDITRRSGLGLLLLAIGRKRGFTYFGADTDAYLASLAPLVAFALVAAALLALQSLRDAATLFLLSICQVLAPAVIAHPLCRRWNRAERWALYANILNWAPFLFFMMLALALAVARAAVEAGAPAGRHRNDGADDVPGLHGMVSVVRGARRAGFVAQANLDADGRDFPVWGFAGDHTMGFWIGAARVKDGPEVKGSSSFLKKRTKKLLSVGVRDAIRIEGLRQQAKVFCFFFSKKKSTPRQRQSRRRNRPLRLHVAPIPEQLGRPAAGVLRHNPGLLHQILRIDQPAEILLVQAAPGQRLHGVLQLQ